MAPWGFRHLNHFGVGEPEALRPWMVKPYNRRQLAREERIVNYRISDRKVVENAFSMEKRPKVFRDIVFICVVLHNMRRIHQGGADRAPTPANDVETL